MSDWFLMGLLDESSVVSLFKRGDRRFLIGSDAFLTVKFELGITSFDFLSSFILSDHAKLAAIEDLLSYS